MNDREISLDEAFKPISKYEIANKYSYISFRVLNIIKNKLNRYKREELLYRIDKLTCDFMEENNIELKDNEDKSFEPIKTFLIDEMTDKYKSIITPYLNLLIQEKIIYNNEIELNYIKKCKNTFPDTIFKIYNTSEQDNVLLYINITDKNFLDVFVINGVCCKYFSPDEKKSGISNTCAYIPISKTKIKNSYNQLLSNNIFDR